MNGRKENSLLKREGMEREDGEKKRSGLSVSLGVNFLVKTKENISLCPRKRG
jgi:hypothetical protein